MALACLLAALFAFSRAGRVGLFGTAFALGVAAYLACSWPGSPHAGHFWRWPLAAICIVVPALFWLFARAMFEDEFRPGVREAAAVLLLLALGSAVMSLGRGEARLLLGMLLRLCGLALVAHAIWIVARGRAADLVERRRRFRAPFVILSGSYVAMVGIAEIVLGGSPAPIGLSALNALGILTLTFVTMIYFTGLRPEVMAIPSEEPAPASPIAPATRQNLPKTPPDEALLARLNALMDQERIYRREGLTIGMLAEKLGTQEYLLRRLINGRLGQRNFNAFLNGFRLADAKAALADPSQAGVPILTIALDAGFASLGPFNRAFRADTGLTPTEFRRKSADRANP